MVVLVGDEGRSSEFIFLDLTGDITLCVVKLRCSCLLSTIVRMKC